MALMSYLIRDPAGTYYFRRVIPPALRGVMPAPWTGKSAWKRNLGTKDPAKAKRAAARFLSDCAADFELAERIKRGEAVVRPPRPAVSLNADDIERDVLAELLAGDEAERSELDPRKQRLAVYPDGDRQFVMILSAVPEAGLEAVEVACANALAARLHSADAVLDLLARGREPEPPPPVITPSSLTLGLMPEANCARYDGLRTLVRA